MRKLCFKFLCLGFSLGLAVLGLEWHYRHHRTRDYWRVEDLLSDSVQKRFPFTFDAELAFRPKFDGVRYTECGTQVNGYALAKRPGVERVLFVGDSATARGQLVAAVARIYGAERFEYWNAGIDGFDTSQERILYEGYNWRIEPDHVVLVLHNNDFTSQPVLAADDRGCVTLYGAGATWRVRLPWLARRSELVRRKLAQVWLDRREADGRQRVERDLATLAGRFSREGRQFSVVVLPILKPLAGWSATQLANREAELAICRRLGLRTFDPLPAVERAARDGVDPCETPGDLWHPGDAGAAYLAAFLADEGLLGSVRGGPNELAAKPVH